MSGMIILATVFVTLAAALHVGIFIMESVSWTRPAIWKRFGLASQEAAETTKPLAYNQGFYNLFLAGGAAVGLVLYWTTLREVGFGLVFFSATCMVLASVVLLTTGRSYVRAALIQGVLPLAGLVAFILA
jgi:putative membrane protein